MTTPYTYPPQSTLQYEPQQRMQDDSHLKALAICHFIWGGLGVLLALLPLIHVGIGIAMISGALENAGNGSPPPREVGWLLVVFGTGAIILGETIAILTIISGSLLLKRRARVFSMVIAGINCISVPIGTVLGIFTIVVLSRESVRRQYAEDAAQGRRPVATPRPWGV